MNLGHLYNKIKMASNISVERFNAYSTILLFKSSENQSWNNKNMPQLSNERKIWTHETIESDGKD